MDAGFRNLKNMDKNIINKNKKIILCPNPNRDPGMKATREAERILKEIGYQIVICPPFRDRKKDAFHGLDIKPLQKELSNAFLLVTFGGDGTILHLARTAAASHVPVLGVNTGELGFIAELEAGELDALYKLNNLKNGLKTEKRMMLDITVTRDGKRIYHNIGLNDAVIREGPISHVIHLKIESDEKYLTEIAGDGVIISTPTGSTAYSLSAGGPVIEPSERVLQVCPICAHAMRFPSYILSGEHVISVELERNGRKPVYLFVDESNGFPIGSGDRVIIKKSRYVLELARLTERGFSDIFARKMLTRSPAPPDRIEI